MVNLDRTQLQRLSRIFGLLLITAVGYVLLDFMIDLRPAAVQNLYQFKIGDLDYDRPTILRQDNLQILVIKRSPATVARLTQELAQLQDPHSAQSRQPAFAKNRLRSRDAEYFVSYAIGTDLGCSLLAIPQGLREICGGARYDFAGRALQAINGFPNLPIPDYNFTDNFKSLNIRP